MVRELKKITLRPSEVKELFGVPESTLANLRWAGKGPRFFRKPGGRGIFYLIGDVQDWLCSNPVDPNENGRNSVQPEGSNKSLPLEG